MPDVNPHKVTILAAIALGGAVGAVSRYSIGVFVHRWLGQAFPFGTLVVNIAGCYLFGLIASLTVHSASHHWRAFLTTGLLGALTTFSTFGYETVHRIESGQLRVAAMNVALSVVIGLLAVWLGLSTGRMFVGKPA